MKFQVEKNNMHKVTKKRKEKSSMFFKQYIFITWQSEQHTSNPLIYASSLTHHY